MSDTRKQLGRFVVVGVVATGADAIVYGSLLATLLPDQTGTSKALAFVVGTVVSFVLNKLWTFESTTRDPKQAVAFFTLYAASLLLNVAVNQLVLRVADPTLPVTLARPLGFVCATGASMVTNFIGQKFWVFRDADS